MQFNIIFKTIFEYIHDKFCFVHTCTNTFCKYRKKLLASPRVHLVIQEIVIIKATRLQAWALAGGARVGRCPPPPLENKIKILGLYWLFATFSLYGGLFATFFSFWGPFHHVGPFRYFLVHGGGLFWACPPPTKISAGAHDCKEGSRACSPEIFCVTAI